MGSYEKIRQSLQGKDSQFSTYELDARWNSFDGTNPAAIPKGFDIWSKETPNGKIKNI